MLALLSSCSFAFMHRPTPEAPSDCVDQYEAPLFDTLVALGAVAVTAGVGIADAAGGPSKNRINGPSQYSDLGLVTVGTLPLKGPPPGPMPAPPPPY